jgi:signal transduction histidine kinase
MNGLFIRLYLILIIAVIGLGISIDTYVDQQNNQQAVTSDIELHKGTFFLLNKELQRIPAQERVEYLSFISPSFGYPIKLSLREQLNLTEAQQTFLQQGGIVSHFDDKQGKAWFYQKLSKSNQIMVLGPINIEPSISSNLITNIIFFGGLALIIFLWAWPISQGLNKLTTAATAFGKGDFSVRAEHTNAAPLKALVTRFNAMANRIQRLIKSHQELSHAVSHELRTPIARIRFAMEMVKELDDQTQQQKYLQSMDDNIEELDGLVDELLTYARFDRDEPILHIQPNNIVLTCYQIIDKFSLPHSQLTFSCNVPENAVITCPFDADAISRAIDNLVRNACRYAKNKIHIVITMTEKNITVAVEDDGIGVPKSARKTLFDPFVRLDQSRDRNSGGIGLGLAMVKRLVELHHGNASVSDAEIGGAKFILSWPRN